MIYDARLTPLCLSIAARAHIVLQDDGCTNLVDKRLVLSSLLLQPPINHCSMSQHRGKALIVELNGYLLMIAPTVDKLLHSLQVLTGLSIGLAGFANNDSLNWFTSDVVDKKIVECGRRNSRQSACNDLQGIGDCYSCTFLTVVDG